MVALREPTVRGVGLVKPGSQYGFVCRGSQWEELLNLLTEYTLDSELDFNAHDAAVVGYLFNHMGSLLQRIECRGLREVN